jgi:NhaA family Na+:H+ antiporter
LASWRKAALPVTAAFGGMAVPALIYIAFNVGGSGADGWGIPMGTDIAFAMGVLALLGGRVPFSLKVFVLALAIVDDLGSIAVIAIAYTSAVSMEAITWSLLVIAAIVVASRTGFRSTWLYLALGIALWLAVFKSGLHATLAGVALAMLTPARPALDAEGFDDAASSLLDNHREAVASNDTESAAAAVGEVERLARDTISPLDRLEEALHPWSSFFIVPVFALANAGVTFSSALVHDALASPVTFGAGLGLLLGKPIGILLASWLAVRLGFAALPENTTFLQILGAGIVAGIGFTVSLFIAGLAFDHPEMVAEAKIGVLSASIIAGTIGCICLSIVGKRPAT